MSPEIFSRQSTVYEEPKDVAPEQGQPREIEPRKKSGRSLLGGVTPGGKMGLIFAIVGVFVVIAFVLTGIAPKKHPVATSTANQQQQQQRPAKPSASLPTDRAQGPQQGLNPTSEDMTPEKIQKSVELGPHNNQPTTIAGNHAGEPGVNSQQSNGNLEQIQPFTPPPIPGAGNGQWTPAPYGGGSLVTSSEQQMVSARRAALATASMTFVNELPTQAGTAGQEAEANNPIDNLGYRPGYHLSTHLETVACTAIASPVIAVVDYDYQRDGVTIIPAGSRLIGTIGGSNATGLVNLRFTSIRLPNGDTSAVSAVGLNHQLMPLKGIVTGRHVFEQFMLALLGSTASLGTVFAGNNVNGTITDADLLRMQAASSASSSTSQEIGNIQQSVSQNIVVTVPAGTQVEAMFTSQVTETQAVKALTEK